MDSVEEGYCWMGEMLPVYNKTMGRSQKLDQDPRMRLE